MRVVQVVESGGGGGGQQVALEITRHLRAWGHEVLAVSPTTGPLFDALSGVAGGVILPFASIRHPGCVARAIRCLRAYRPAMVHTHLTCAGNLVWRLAAAAAGTPLVQHVHVENYFGTHPLKARIARILDRATSRIPRRYIAVSRHTAGRLAGDGYPTGRVGVVWNGVQVPQPGPPVGSLCGGARFVCVARLSPSKGQLELIRAFSRAFSSRGTAELWLIGADLEGGAYEESLRQQVEDLGIQKQVQFWGHREDAQELMRQCDVLVLFSWMEAFPLALLEAMSLGLAVVATSVAGVPEMVTDDVSGVLVAPGDQAALAAAMARLSTDPVLRQRLGNAGRRVVAENFTVERMLEGVQAVYADVQRSLA